MFYHTTVHPSDDHGNINDSAKRMVAKCGWSAEQRLRVLPQSHDMILVCLADVAEDGTLKYVCKKGRRSHQG
jgi:hypothetical protein